MPNQLKKEHLAKEAKRLSEDAVLLKALSDAKLEALEDLVGIDPFNGEEVAAQQALVKALDKLPETLYEYIVAQE